MIRLLRRFLRKENGSSTVEFVILLPAFLAIFISSFETGLMMVRNVMMERGVDLAVRELRLGTPDVPSFEEFKTLICENAVIIADCQQTLQVELRPISTTTWGPLIPDPNCLDLASDLDPLDQTEYSVGTNNELMLVRVCALFEPISPLTTIALAMPRYQENYYALIATSAFVNEPSR